MSGAEKNTDITVPELRPLDLAALSFIVSEFVKTGFTPTTTELSKYLEIGSGSSTNKVYVNLEAHGLITFAEGRKRYIPTNWRELVEKEFAQDLGYAGRRDVPYAADWSRAQTKVSTDMEQTRALQRKRAKKYRDGRKKK